MKMRNVRAPYNMVLGVATEDIKKGAAIEQVPDLPPLTIHDYMYAAEKEEEVKQLKSIEVKCPYCSHAQPVYLYANQSIVIICSSSDCKGSFAVKLIDSPIIKISKISWE